MSGSKAACFLHRPCAPRIKTVWGFKSRALLAWIRPSSLTRKFVDAVQFVGAEFQVVQRGHILFNLFHA